MIKALEITITEVIVKLAQRGFDLSLAEHGVVKAKCSGCTAPIVLGVATHDDGCKNKGEALIDDYRRLDGEQLRLCVESNRLNAVKEGIDHRIKVKQDARAAVGMVMQEEIKAGRMDYGQMSQRVKREKPAKVRRTLQIIDIGQAKGIAVVK